ncbi:hypothetical protein [Undibacterium sp. WLHG33]|uniref:hypothetical protein n=1 Tax=Undibacterium sp. WLHG33 TaxID=3412482 RepID=UPI003C2B822F
MDILMDREKLKALAKLRFGDALGEGIPGHDGLDGGERIAARLLGLDQRLADALFELPFWVLVEAADADVTDALTVQGILLREMCQEEICDP